MDELELGFQELRCPYRFIPVFERLNAAEPKSVSKLQNWEMGLREKSARDCERQILRNYLAVCEIVVSRSIQRSPFDIGFDSLTIKPSPSSYSQS